jgi:hypothetical protein
MFVFAVATLALAVTAFTSLPLLQTSAANVKCGMYSTLDVALNGDGVMWGGFQKLKDQLGNISSALSSAQTAINTYFNDNSWLVTDTQAMKNANLNLYKTYNTSSLFSPAPGVATNITPYFIHGSLGPDTNPNTMVYDIDQGLQITQGLTNQAILVDQSAKLVSDSAAIITNNIGVSQSQLDMYNTQLSNFNSELDVFSSRYFDQLFTWGIYAMEGIVGFILAACLMVIAGGISTHCFDMYNCRTMVHLGWGILGIMYFGVLGMTYIFLPVGSIGIDMCKVYQQTLNNQSYYSKWGQHYSQNLLTKLDVCVNGNGSILGAFNSLDEMNTVSGMFSKIATYNQMVNTSSSTYVNLANSTSRITAWSATVANYREGKFDDSLPGDSSLNNPYNSLYSLNGFTTRGTGAMNCTQDLWVYDEVNCTAGMAVYTPGTLVQGTYLQTTPVCFSFNSKLQTSSPSIWTSTDFNNRYVSIMVSCNTAYNGILSYGFSIIRYRDSRINLYTSIGTDISNLLTMNNNYNTKLGVFGSNLTAFSTAVSTLNSLMNDQLSGLSVSSNCTVVSSYMRYAYNEYCIKFMSEVSKLGLYFLLMSMVMIGVVITSSVFAIKYANVERVMVRVVPQLSNTVVKMDNKSESEQSSEFEDLD